MDFTYISQWSDTGPSWPSCFSYYKLILQDNIIVEIAVFHYTGLTLKSGLWRKELTERVENIMRRKENGNKSVKQKNLLSFNYANIHAISPMIYYF